MKRPKVRLEIDPGLDCISVVIRAPEQNDEVAELLRQLGGGPPGAVTVFDGEGVVRTVPADEIVLASVSGKLVNIITAEGSWFTRRTLQGLEAELDERHFLRISRFELVNLDKVLRYDFTVAGTLRLELAGGMETWASRRCIPAIRKRLMERE